MKDIHKTRTALKAEKQKQLLESKRVLEKKVREQIADLKHGNEALEREISDRIEAESRLRESNDLLESVFSNIHMSIAYLDTDFYFIRVNEAYAAAAEMNIPGLIGQALGCR